MSKFITFKIQLDNDLDRRLRAVSTHFGSMSHLIREGIRMVVEREEAKKRILDKTTIEITTDSEGNCDCKCTGA